MGAWQKIIRADHFRYIHRVIINNNSKLICRTFFITGDYKITAEKLEVFNLGAAKIIRKNALPLRRMKTPRRNFTRFTFGMFRVCVFIAAQISYNFV